MSRGSCDTRNRSDEYFGDCETAEPVVFPTFSHVQRNLTQLLLEF